MKEYLYILEMSTRDYECDIQGVVNNANYQHYFEATRHQWLREEGFSFSKWHEEGIDLMVSEINIKYKVPLRGQEDFLSCFNMRREGPRFVFDQDIYRKSDMTLCASGKISCVCLVKGRLTRGDEIAPYFSKYLTRTE
ncbi:MAG: acyl-CoA thioesterase [Bacteroidales bacterium]|nr:acyl-CoA thioesterase [Bacteroidales bacterium]